MLTRANRADDADKPQEADPDSSLSGSHATDETSLEW